jgi:hypothetical protein
MNEENRGMTKIPAVVALALLIAAPAYAQSAQVKAKKKNKSVTTYQQPASPSGNPEWDVYVRGEYVGSDPDPRVRYTLRQEAVRNYGIR